MGQRALDLDAGHVVDEHQPVIQSIQVHRVALAQWRKRPLQNRVADSALVVQGHAVVDAFLDGDLHDALDDLLRGQVGAGKQIAAALIKLGDTVGGGAQAVKALLSA
ncbi:hypothetical protein G6F31_019172 [Rhizopus arrhizus]|nr:hypothetical protein G6F31_019172 [Rhizopus arrhizus]